MREDTEILPIVQQDNPVLRARAHEIAPGDIGTTSVQTFIDTMLATLAAEKMGAALAAPQVGESLRLFVVSPDVLRKKPNSGDGSTSPLVCINPEIIKRSKETKQLHEGCLSVRGWWGHIERYEKVTMRALDRDGREFTRGASGLLAQIFQHEIDHLDGKLYIDSATDMHTDEELKRREATEDVAEARKRKHEQDHEHSAS